MTTQERFIVWLAQGFGVGRIPFAPGTWGSVIGIGWFLLLTRLMCEWEWMFPIGTVAGILIAVGLCGRAEQILGRRDPGSVVLDEIAAVPLSLTALIVMFNDAIRIAAWFWPFPARTSPGPALVSGPLPPLEQTLFRSDVTPIFFAYIIIGFLLFRLFDIWKPWPIRQSQRLPGGWGIVMDDVLAAVYVNLVMLGAWWVFSLIGL